VTAKLAGPCAPPHSLRAWRRAVAATAQQLQLELESISAEANNKDTAMQPAETVVERQPGQAQAQAQAQRQPPAAVPLQMPPTSAHAPNLKALHTAGTSLEPPKKLCIRRRLLDAAYGEQDASGGPRRPVPLDASQRIQARMFKRCGVMMPSESELEPEPEPELEPEPEPGPEPEPEPEPVPEPQSPEEQQNQVEALRSDAHDGSAAAVATVWYFGLPASPVRWLPVLCAAEQSGG
jgi:hypothetical protein